QRIVGARASRRKRRRPARRGAWELALARRSPSKVNAVRLSSQTISLVSECATVPTQLCRRETRIGLRPNRQAGDKAATAGPQCCKTVVRAPPRRSHLKLHVCCDRAALQGPVQARRTRPRT